MPVNQHCYDSLHNDLINLIQYSALSVMLADTTVQSGCEQSPITYMAFHLSESVPRYIFPFGEVCLCRYESQQLHLGADQKHRSETTRQRWSEGFPREPLQFDSVAMQKLIQLNFRK